MTLKAEELKQAVVDRYGAIARGEAPGCGCSDVTAVATTIGYSKEDLALAGEANLGLGCGNPLALAAIEPGMTVLDLGSGAGFDAFLAWRRVGETGRVIGVDMTDDMLTQARANAEKLGVTNVEFRKGLIEALPVEDNSVDLIISNCVINLSTDKPAVFREMIRVLKPGGRFTVSDLVLLGELPEQVMRDVSAYVGCVSGASPVAEYINLAAGVGFEALSIPEITVGSKLIDVMATSSETLATKKSSCCGGSSETVYIKPEIATQAARAVASIRMTGRKP